MPLPLIPIAALAAKTSIPVILKVVAAVATVGGTSGIAYGFGKEKGKYIGETKGRADQAKADSKKFLQQEESHRRQVEGFKKEKAEFEEILEYYEKYIEKLQQTLEEITEANSSIQKESVEDELKNARKERIALLRSYNSTYAGK